MSEVLGGIGGSYQLDPGVDADSDGIHRLHIVPPVSGDIKHLNRKERKMSLKKKSPFVTTAHTTVTVPHIDH